MNRRGIYGNDLYTVFPRLFSARILLSVTALRSFLASVFQKVFQSGCREENQGAGFR